MCPNSRRHLDSRASRAHLGGMRYALATVIVAASISGARAIDVGDVISLSSNGVGSTVVSHRVAPTGLHELSAQTLETNISEYCERYEDVHPSDKGWANCLQSNKSSEKLELQINCKRPTVIVAGDGAYRPSRNGGPWVSVANPNSIIQADQLFSQVCGPRR